MNEDYLAEQLELIDEYVRRARSIAERGELEFLEDPILVDAATRQITVLFETCHNIAKHLIGCFDWQSADTKAQAFEVLEQRGVIESELSEAMRQAARFRNLATYRTTVVDDRIVYRILSTRLDDFEGFASQTASWIQREGGVA